MNQQEHNIKMKESHNKIMEVMVKNYFENFSIKENLEQLGTEDTKSGTVARIIAILKRAVYLNDLEQAQIIDDIYIKANKNKKNPIFKKNLLNQMLNDFKPKEETNNKEKEDEFKYTSMLSNDNLLVEQVYQNDKNLFCVYDFKTEKFSYVTEIFFNGEWYKPISDEEVVKKAVLLPSNVEEYNDDELDKEIKEFIKEWLDVPDDFVQFALWNIKRSWVFDRFRTLNYLRALGDFGTGKSRFLDTLGHIHYKPIFIGGGTTTAPIFRIIEKWRGTIIIDEADFKQTDESQDIMKIINLGYEKGKSIMRCDQNDASKINFFDPYCPKIIATRNVFYDKATESRCFTQIMTGTNRGEIKVILTEDFFKQAEHIRNKLLLWRFKNYVKINEKTEYTFDFDDLEPRIRQISIGLLPLFYHDEKQMNLFKKFVYEQQEKIIEERQDTFDGQIIKAIIDFLNNGQTEISNSDIISACGFLDRKGKEMQPRALTKYLKSLGFGRNLLMRTVTGIKKVLVIDDKHIQKLAKRYGYKYNNVTVVTVVTETLDKKSNILNLSTKTQNNIYVKKSEELSHIPVTTVTPVTESIDKKIFNRKQIYDFCNKIKPIEEVLKHCENVEWTKQTINDMLKMGEIFEIKPGFLKAI